MPQPTANGIGRVALSLGVIIAMLMSVLSFYQTATAPMKDVGANGQAIIVLQAEDVATDRKINTLETEIRVLRETIIRMQVNWEKKHD